MRAVLSFILISIWIPAAALAQSVTVNFTGTVTITSGEMDGVVSANDTSSGSITYDASTAGTFTAPISSWPPANSTTKAA